MAERKFSKKINNEYETDLIAAKFKGHRGSVLCLDVSDSFSSSHQSKASYLLSGSDDARLWDLRDHRRRACLCIETSGEVMSAVFSPSTISSNLDPSELSSNFAKDFIVYLGVDNTVLEYDLRKATSPILSYCGSNSNSCSRDIGEILQHQDEVNQISLAYGTVNSNIVKRYSKRGKGGKRLGVGGKKHLTRECLYMEDSSPPSRDITSSLYLAACDDVGTVRFMDLSNISCQSSEKSSILHHDSTGTTVTTACSFRPRNNQSSGGKYKHNALQLVSGGTDCKINLWDLSKPRKPISSFTIRKDLWEDNGQNRPQVCNPPMVHTLAWSPSGHSLAAGLGDGSIAVFAIENCTLIQTGLLSEGSHDSSVASVIFPSLSSDSSERILCSAGTDGKIIFWDLGTQVDLNYDRADNGTVEADDETPLDLSQLFSSSLDLECQQQYNLKKTTEASAECIFGPFQPKIMLKVSHCEKINFLTRATSSMTKQWRDTIFVADTSSEITSYTIPNHRNPT